MQPLFIESNLLLDIVLDAEGTAMKWKAMVSALVTDEAGKSKQGWNLDFGLYLKSNRKLLKGFGQARNMIRLYFRYTILNGM